MVITDIARPLRSVSQPRAAARWKTSRCGTGLVLDLADVPIPVRFGIRAGKSSQRIYSGVARMASFSSSTWASKSAQPCGTKYLVPAPRVADACLADTPEHSRQDPGLVRSFRSADDPPQVFSRFLVSAPMDAAWSMSPHIRRRNGPPTNRARRFDRMRRYLLRERLATSRTSHSTTAVKRMQ